MGVEQPTDLKRFYVSSYKSHLMGNKYAVATINKKINSLQAFNLFLIDRRLTTEQVVTLRKDRIRVAAGSEGEVEAFSEQEVNQNVRRVGITQEENYPRLSKFESVLL